MRALVNDLQGSGGTMKRIFIFIAWLLFSAHLASAQTLDCKVIPGRTDDAAEIAKSSAVLSDDDFKAGYRVMGGGCVQAPHDGEQFRWNEMSKPEDRDYYCQLRGNSHEAVNVTAYAVACRVVPRPLGRVAHFSSNGLGGGIVTIARTSDDSPNYTTPIPFSIRVCNLEGGTPIGVYYGVGSDNVTNYKIVPYRQCFEVDKPKELMFHTTETVSIDVAGKYELFKPGTFSGATVC